MRDSTPVAAAVAAVIVCGVVTIAVASPQCEVDRLIAFDGRPIDLFGAKTALSGDTLVVTSERDGDLGFVAGAAYAYRRDGSGWLLEGKFHGSDTVAGDWFGNAIDMQGARMLIGAYENDDGRGAVYAYERQGEAWVEVQKLVASDASSDDNFAFSVAFDGDWAIVGANDASPGGGAAYVFKHDGQAWAEMAILSSPDGSGGDDFGWSVDIMGTRAIVGATGHDEVASRAGAAYLFERSGDTWSFDAKLVAADGAQDDLFGFAVAVGGDWAAIGAPNADGAAVDSGAMYFFHPEGDEWALTNRIPGGAGDSASLGFQLETDGDRVVAASLREDIGNAGGAGVAYVYQRLGGTWGVDRRLQRPTGLSTDSYAQGVSISGTTVVAGAHRERGLRPDTGAAYIFDISGVDGDGDHISDDCDNCPDRPNPYQTDCNHNGIGDVCDIASGTSDDCNTDGIPDECQAEYTRDDGRADQFLRLFSHEALILNQYAVEAGRETVVAIDVVFGWVDSPTPAIAAIYSDPNGDGNPDDGEQIASAEFLAQTSELDAFATVAFPPTVVGAAGDSFFVGVFIGTSRDAWPAVDVNGAFGGASWLAYGGPGAIDPVHIAESGEPPARMDDVGLASNFLIRARTTGGLACACREDVNGDGIAGFADVLQILGNWGPCAECPEDVDDNGVVDFGDILAVLASWGPCT